MTAHDAPVGFHAPPTGAWDEDDIAALGVAIRSRGIGFVFAPDAAAALDIVMGTIPSGVTVMNGGSATLERIGVLDALERGPYTFLRPGIRAMARGEDRVVARRRAAIADYFIGGVNAITRDGEIVNVDGSGNRIAAYAYGAGRVLMVAGTNKIVPDLAAAFARLRSTAAPAECRALGKRTPCVVTGVCDNAACRGEERQCGKILVIEHEKIEGRMTLVLVGERMGY